MRRRRGAIRPAVPPRCRRCASELEWQLFLRDEVKSRFPEGLIVWDAEG
ncbi:MAG: hypothetical protein DMF87_05460 [Acidobacteria bacterium]|nr:MAG: hypothetical protein DMF87_05460 [Acidobacteriota bacterium]